MPRPFQSAHSLVIHALAFFPDPSERDGALVIEADRAALKGFVHGKGDPHRALFLARVYVEEYTSLAYAGFGDRQRLAEARSLTRAINRTLKGIPCPPPDSSNTPSRS